MAHQGADVIVEILQREGIEVLAGFPQNRLFNAAAKSQMRPLIARTERVAINIADAYIRMNNGQKLAAVAVQDGPGIEASFAAVAQAYGDNTPLLVLPGAHAKAMQDYDPQFMASRSFRDITKRAELINDPKTIGRKLERAFGLLKNGKGGPVLLETAAEVMWGTYPDESFSYESPRRYRSKADESDVAELLDRLEQAERPILVAGHGVLYAEAWEELLTFAELMQIPVTTTLLGKSAFPESHELALGTAGRTITKAAGHFANEADFILGVGTSFTINDFTARMPEGKTLGQITNDPSDIGKCRPIAAAAVGDAKLVLQQLIALGRARHGEGRPRNQTQIDEIASLHKAFRAEWEERLDCADEGPISPYRIITEMDRLFDKSATVVTHDAGNPRDQIVPFYHAETPRGYLGWGKSTHLGSSLGMALGAKLAKPDWLSVQFVGDAGFGMAGMDYETAVRAELPILTVLLNNGVMGGYGAYMPDAVENFASNQLTGQYAKVADALGAYSETVTAAGDVRDALTRGVEQTKKGRPALLEFITREEPVLAMANKWGM